MYFRWWHLKLPFFVEPSATISTWKWVVASKFVQAVFSLSCCIQTIRYDIFCGSKQIRGNLLSKIFNPLKVCVLRLKSSNKHYMVGRLVVLFLLELICSTSCLSAACNIFDFQLSQNWSSEVYSCLIDLFANNTTVFGRQWIIVWS